MFGILLAVIIVGWVGAAIIGTQAYFMGEQSKPIHERNLTSDGFESMAKLVTGRDTDYSTRVSTFSGDAYSSTVLNS
ncbi:MAG: hypothetical protein AAF572_25975 [Cyanobacteria bacterium P01_B01_bin.77]